MKVTLTSVLNQINLIPMLNQINIIPTLNWVSLAPMLNPASQTGPVRKHKAGGVCVINDIAQTELTLREWRTYIQMR